VVTGLRTDRREVLVTTVLDSDPTHRHEMPGPSIGPLAMAVGLGTGLILSVWTPWGLPVAFTLGFAALPLWAWPRRTGRAEDRELGTVE
jgi:cytochrome c oxidase subunit 1